DVVRVLSVNDWLAVRSFTLLEKQRVLPLGYCCRLKAEHRAQRQLSSAKRTLRHWHEPVRREELVISAGTGLLYISNEGIGVEHEHPVTAHGHHHRHRGRIRFSTSAGRCVHLNGSGETRRPIAHVHLHFHFLLRHERTRSQKQDASPPSVHRSSPHR